MTEKEFILAWAKDYAPSLKIFPDDFIGNAEVSKIAHPDSRLNLGSELFGTFEIIDGKGKTFHTAQSLPEAKYYIYSNRSKADTLVVPVAQKELDLVVASYEKYLDDIIKLIMKDYAKKFPEGKNPHEAVTQIFYQLNLVRF
jgi:hypothetical protein